MASDDGEGLLDDRISDLPDCILVSILSLLPIDEAARASVLASRWRRLFPCTLLDFKASLPGRDRDVAGAFTSILAAHPAARVRSFRTGWLHLPGHLRPSPLDGWLQDLAGRGVEEISLCFRGARQQLPRSLFACAALRRVYATGCTFPNAAKAAAPLARLAEVELADVTVSDRSLHALLSHCEALCSVSKCPRVHVRSPSLRSLSTSAVDLDEIFVEDAPNLEQLLGDCGYMKGLRLKIAHAPKLEFLGYLGMSFCAIEIGNSIFREDEIQVQTLLPSLKTLAVLVSYTTEGYINWLMQLLKMFPRLETLYIKSDSWSVVQEAAPDSWDLLTSVPCIDNHLEKVVFEVYRGHEWQREMAKFLHGRSRFLKTMEFHCMDDTCREDYGKPPTEEWVVEQRELLSLDSRASRDARFLFFKGQLVNNHQYICHHQWYKREYYCNLYEV